MASEDLMAYMAGQENSGRNNGMFGGGGIYDLLALALVFGAWGGGGFGFGGGFGGGGAGFQGMATRADINEAFALNGIENGIHGIQQGICDSTYGLTSSINSGFNSLSAQLAQCCCDNRAAVADLKYTIGSEFCALGNTMQSGFRDIIDNNNAGFRAILDFMVQEKLSSKDARIAALESQLGRVEQNGVIRAAIDASTAEIIRRTGNDYPTASFLVQPPTPVNFPTNGCGQVQFGGWNNSGCGWGC